VSFPIRIVIKRAVIKLQGKQETQSKPPTPETVQTIEQPKPETPQVRGQTMINN
jgi:hypothetical protein